MPTIPMALPHFSHAVRPVILVVMLVLEMSMAAQIETGSWQDLPNLSSCKSVAAADGAAIVLVAGETAVYGLGLDETGHATGEVQRFGKADGLSRAEIETLVLAPEWGWAIVAYQQGTFDLISMDVDGTLGSVVSVDDLAEADIPGNKRPNKLVVVGDRLLICTDIGVVEYDLVNLEVRDTWKLEFGGQFLSVRSAVERGGRWWLATSHGVWSAPVDAPFPGDPATWQPEAVLPDGGTIDAVDLVTGEDGRMAVLQRREGPDAIWVGNPGVNEWNEVTDGLGEVWNALATDGSRLWASTPFGVMLMDEGWGPAELNAQLGNVYLEPKGLSATSDGVWIANAHSGALWIGAEGVGAGYEGPFAPNGPRSNSAWRLDAWNDRLWVATGGTEASGVPLYRQEGFSGRKGTYWWTVSPPEGEAGGAGIQDPMEVSIDPTRPERVVFGSLEEGLIELELSLIHI